MQRGKETLTWAGIPSITQQDRWHPAPRWDPPLPHILSGARGRLCGGARDCF